MKNNKKKKWLVTAAALAAVAAMAGTFAWFTSTDNVKNEFEGGIAGNDIEIVETFTKPDTWEPGQEVNKDVAIMNTGNYDSLIRVSLKETMSLLKNAKVVIESDVAKLPTDYYLFPLGTVDTAGYKDATLNAAVTKDFPKIGQAKLIVKEKEDKTLADGTKVYKYVSYWETTSAPSKQFYAKTGGFDRAANGTITPKQAPAFKFVSLERNTDVVRDWADQTNLYKPVFTANGASVTAVGASDQNIIIEFANLTVGQTPEAGKWFYNDKDGNFYFMGVVKPQAQTAQLIDSVTLSSNANNDYSKLKFSLDVNAKGIQAFKEAVDSTEWVNKTNDTLAKALQALPGVKEGNGKVNP